MPFVRPEIVNENCVAGTVAALITTALFVAIQLWKFEGSPPVEYVVYAIRYPLIAGAFGCTGVDQLNATCPLPETAERLVTALAWASGMVMAETKAPVPRFVTAATLKVYVCPLVRPEIV